MPMRRDITFAAQNRVKNGRYDEKSNLTCVEILRKTIPFMTIPFSMRLRKGSERSKKLPHSFSDRMNAAVSFIKELSEALFPFPRPNVPLRQEREANVYKGR